MVMRYREMLVGKGLKNTKTRALVLEILDHAPNPMTVDEIFLLLKKNEPSINLSTVYRTVDTLVKKDFVVKATLMEDSRARYEYNRMEHKHLLVCVNCSRMIPVKGCPIDEYARTLCSREGFEPTGHRLEIYGVCSDCKKGKS
jgi:Fur family ferric uptake transcriptional regulator